MPTGPTTSHVDGSRPLQVLLINPPRFNELIGKNPAIVEKHRGFNPPLGLMQLAGYVEAHSAHTVDLIDAQPPQWPYEELERVLRRYSPDVVGITAMTFTLIDVMMTCRLVRKIFPDATIVLGGPHVHLFPDESVTKPEVDFLIQGEGEIAFVDFLNHLHEPQTWPEMKGLVYVSDTGEVVNNGVAPSTDDLDQLGMPARHKLDIGVYTSLLGKSDVITTMFTSRGCPFRCTFCDRPFSPVLSGFRWRSAKHVADEMEECMKMGIDEIFIYDDTFTVRKDRVFELCDEIKKRGLKIRWDVRAHVNTVTRELLAAMSEAGCERIHFGVEVGNERMMKEIQKGHSLKRVESAFGWAREVGIETLAYFIIGQQTENIHDIRDTMRLAMRVNADYVHFTIFCPYPGTQIYQQGLEQGLIKQDVWKAFAEDPKPGFELPVWEENFTRQELRELLVECYKTYYMRPGYLLRSVAKIRSAGELGRKLRAGVSLVRMSPDDTVFSKSILEQVQDIVPMASYHVTS